MIPFNCTYFCWLPAYGRLFTCMLGMAITVNGFADNKLSTPVATTPPSSTSSVFTMIFGLLLVLGIMASIAWLLKRSGLAHISGNGIPLKVIGGVSVGTRERVIVIEVADQWIVVGVTPGRINTLATLPRQEYVTTTVTPAAKNFSSWLKQTIEKRHDRSQ